MRNKYRKLLGCLFVFFAKTAYLFSTITALLGDVANSNLIFNHLNVIFTQINVTKAFIHRIHYGSLKQLNCIFLLTGSIFHHINLNF